MTSLPDRNSSEVFLVTATPEEAIAQRRANSEEWRGALDLPAYLRREEVLVDQTLTKDGGLTAWSLVYQPAGSDEKDRQLLCGCETIKKRALVASGNNTVEAVTAHGICSVYCMPEYRGKGYAGRMMADLGEKLKTWQSNGQGNLFSVLYSDIGKVRQSMASRFSIESSLIAV
jgi:GNAT superfamily N-acetyltransferase